MQSDDFLDRWELEAWQRYQTELALISRVAEMRTVSRRDIHDLGHLAARAAIQDGAAPLATPSADPLPSTAAPAAPPPLPETHWQGVPPPGEGDDLSGFDERLREMRQRMPRGVGA